MYNEPSNLNVLRFGPVCGASHRGLVRTSNEDEWGVSTDHRTVVLADGMGGHDAGEIASNTAVRAALSRLRPDPAANILRAFGDAQRAVAPLSRGRLQAPGCTLVVVRFTSDFRTAFFGWTGDSRLYLYRASDGTLHRLTTDHAINGHTLTRCIGAGNTSEPETARCDVASGDSLFLCSDGVHGECADGSFIVNDDTIQDAFRAGTSREDTVRRIVGAAFSNGAPDNVTAVIVRVP